MAIIQQIQCDICGVTRQQANHWFACLRTNHEWVIDPLEVPVNIERIGNARIVCGEDCAHKLLSQWFEKQLRGASE